MIAHTSKNYLLFVVVPQKCTKNQQINKKIVFIKYFATVKWIDIIEIIEMSHYLFHLECIPTICVRNDFRRLDSFAIFYSIVFNQTAPGKKNISISIVILYSIWHLRYKAFVITKIQFFITTFTAYIINYFGEFIGEFFFHHIAHTDILHTQQRSYNFFLSSLSSSIAS